MRPTIVINNQQSQRSCCSFIGRWRCSRCSLSALLALARSLTDRAARTRRCSNGEVADARRSRCGYSAALQFGGVAVNNHRGDAAARSCCCSTTVLTLTNYIGSDTNYNKLVCLNYQGLVCVEGSPGPVNTPLVS
jgi:hypothetical protein